MYSVGNNGSAFAGIFMVNMKKSNAYIDSARLTCDMAGKYYY